MLNTERVSYAPAQQDQSAPQSRPPAATPVHPPVYPMTTPMYYSIGQTPPYPGLYAVQDPRQLNAKPAAYSLAPAPSGYPQNWAQTALQPSLQPPMQPPLPPSLQSQAQVQGQSQLQAQTQAQLAQQQQQLMPFHMASQPPYLPSPYAPTNTHAHTHTHYMPTPLQSPVASLSSPPSLSPGIVSPPAPQGSEPLTPSTPQTANLGHSYTPSTFTFKLGSYNELAPGNGVKHFAQLVIEIFTTRPDEVAFPLVDAMITREFNTQRRKHEDSMRTSELERKDENGYYVCRLCGPEPPRYLHLKSLVRHTSTHFVTKPFICLFCDDRFTRTDVARKHLICCRALRASLARFGPERAFYIQRVMSSAQRCMPGMTGKDRRHMCHKHGPQTSP